MPVPENLLKEAQQAAEEQKSMPGVEDERMRKLHLPASLEKMFQQAKDEQEVEKLTKEGDRKVTFPTFFLCIMVVILALCTGHEHGCGEEGANQGGSTEESC